jgi:hypothetical protein
MTIRCAQCGEEVTDGTARCPHCEYTPYSSMVFVGISMVVVGILISLLTVIGAVFGIPLAVVGLYRIYESSNVTVDSEYWT